MKPPLEDFPGPIHFPGGFHSLQVPVPGAPRLLRLLPRGVVADASSTDATPLNTEDPADDNLSPAQSSQPTLVVLSSLYHILTLR